MFVFFRRLRFVYKKLRLQRLHYALPFLVLCLYTVVGAYVFRYFELEQDEQRRARYRQNTEYAFKRTLNRMLEVRCQDGLDAADQTLQTRHVKEHLFWLMDYLNLTQVIEERSENSPWTWMGAMSYAGQLYTTIGYGLPATQTFEGRLASIVYIMIGIPLFLIILAKAGKLLSRGLRKLYKRMHKMKRFPEAARRMSEPMKAIYHLTYAMASTALGPTAAPLVNGGHPPALAAIKEAEEARTRKIEAENQFRKQQQQQQRLNLPGMANKADEPRERKSFPIPWALAILIVWIMFSAALFCIWETEWGYMNSIYFYFVSISTVGLGDLVPTKRDMMIVNFFMILIGLALLSMCVNLIQEALEKLIEHIINQYIDEIEKIAAVVTNTETNEFNEFAEELEPFEVGMTEMLTVPVTTLGGGEHKVQGIGSSVKDWIAERASNMLLNKIYPEQSDSSSSSSSSSEGEEEEEADSEAEALQELEEVVVIDREPVMLHGAARVTVHRPSLVQLIEKRRIEALGQLVAHNLLPQISIHEGTPPGPVQLEEARRHRSAMPAGADGRKVSINERQSLASTPGREGSGRRKKAKKPPKVPKNFAGALLKYSAPTMQAIQAIEYAKLRTGRSNDFKSRLFAKFATNQRFAQIVECNAPAPPKHMVSSSIQTSPVQSPLPARRKSWRLRKMGCAVESIDSTSSELNVTTTRTNASCSANDIDSLYSNTYFDMCFGNYNSDSVPCLMAQLNTPQQQPQPGHRPTEEQPSLAVRRKFSEKLFGLFGRIRPARQNSSAERQGEVDGMEAAGGKDGSGQHLSNSSRRRPHPFLCHSTPVSPATNRRYLANDSTTQPSIPTTPLIHLTDTVDAADQMRLSLTPSPSPAEALLDPAQRQDPDWAKARHNHSQLNARPANSPIGLVPLHHRSLSGRRRFSASTTRLHPCAQRHNQLNEQATRSSSLTTLQRRQQLPPRPATAAAAEHHQQQQQQQQPSAVDNTQQQLTNLRNGPVEEKLLISNSNSSAALLRSSSSAEAAAAADGEKESTQPGVGLLEEAGTK